MEATQESNLTGTDTGGTSRAARFAELAHELMRASEASARERTAEHIAHMLEDVAAKRSGKPETASVPVFAIDALLEAQRMSEACSAIVHEGINGTGQLDYAMLQALRACLLCLDEAVDPAIEALQERQARPA